MSEDPARTAHQLRSWRANADAWASVIQQGRIPSRRRTDAAIVDAVVQLAPRRVLDVGCGEGWLVRALVDGGIDAVGVDATPELIALARSRTGGQYRVATFAEIAAGALGDVGFDTAVCNFALLDDVQTEALVRAMPDLLPADGRLVVQTVHPVVASRGAPYASGWRPGSWDGFGDTFVDPPPWYLRTLADWVELFHSSGLELSGLHETVLDDSDQPFSIVFVVRRREGRTDHRE